MTHIAAAPGTSRSRTTGHDSSTSTPSPAPSKPSPSLPHLPSPSPQGDPTEQGASSLYALGIQAQDISGEIALAAELLATDDPEQEASAVRLIEQYLSAQEHTAGLILSKADHICYFRDKILAQANFRKQQAKRLAELADADFKRAQSLQDYMMKVLTALHPGQSSFSLPSYEIKSRRSSSVVIEDESALPDEFLVSQTTYRPDKAGIKQALKAGASIPGAHIEERINWSIS